MMSRLSSIILLTIFLLPAHLFADDWGQQEGGDLPPAALENRIIKWCQQDGQRVRYASANLKINGYEPCGKISTVATCDAAGNRFISNGESKRYGHRDCSAGPRIVLINHDKDDVIDTSSLARSNDEIIPLTSKEQIDLKRDFADAKKRQNENPEILMQKIADQVMNSFLGKSSSKKRNASSRRRTNQPDAYKQIETLLQFVDPQTKKALRQLLK